MRMFGKVLLLLIFLPLAASAGHALNSPAYTTSPGDLWVSGNFDCDGTGIFGGTLTLDDLVMTGDFSAVGDVIVTGDITCDSFYVGSNLTVADTLTVGGELKGGRCLLACGSQVTNQTGDKYLKGAGGWSFGPDNGYVMHRSGSIVGASFNYTIDSYTPVASVNMEVRVNDVIVYDLTDTLDGTGSRFLYGTQPRGTDTFAVGDFLTAKIDATGTLQYDYPGGFIEVQFDD